MVVDLLMNTFQIDSYLYMHPEYCVGQFNSAGRVKRVQWPQDFSTEIHSVTSRHHQQVTGGVFLL